jgi:hypothetical protein
VNGLRLTEGGYRVNGLGQIECCEVSVDNNGEYQIDQVTPLANFNGVIESVTVLDDGADVRQEFAVRLGLTGVRPLTVRVPAERFGALDWVVPQAGPAFVIRPRQADHLRAAIQELSGRNVATKTMYTHTGWREIAGQWAYLHAGGAIGPDGRLPAIAVSLPDPAGNFRLPQPPAADARRDAVRASRRVLDVAPDAVTFSLLAAIYRAVLGGADFSVWLSGLTGQQKSELGALDRGPNQCRAACFRRRESTCDPQLSGVTCFRLTPTAGSSDKSPKTRPPDPTVRLRAVFGAPRNVQRETLHGPGANDRCRWRTDRGPG